MDKDQHTDQPDDTAEQPDAKILPFPSGHESPTTTEVDVDGQQVQIIYLPWRHEVDGQGRPAGLYYRAPDEAGFYPAPTTRDLDDLLNELVPQLRTHLKAVPGTGDREGV
ncbi:MAG: hypothetical protein WA962_01975 [Ornithinimicrobium sp.]